MYKISVKPYSFYIWQTLLEGFLANIPILSIGLLCLKKRSIEKKTRGGVGKIERRPQIWKFNHTQTSILAKCFLRDWNKATTWRFPFITCTLKGGWSKPWWLHVENCIKYFISFLWFVLKTTYLQVCLWGRDERLWFTSHNTGIKAFTFFITFSTA